MKKTVRILLAAGVLSTALLALTAPSATAEPRDASKYIGTKRCAMCHKKEETGNQYGVWQSLAHAKAYEILASAEAKAVAAELGIDDPQQSGKCLKCHSTAYNFTEELQTDQVAVEDGVSCESCHGPGADYRKKSIMEDREACIANGMVYPAREKSCTLCHNEESPTWKPDRYTTASGEKVGFDVDQAYEKIKHERPSK